MNGSTGVPVEWASELWSLGVGDLESTDFSGGEVHDEPVLRIEMFTRERAEPEIQIGPALESALGQFGMDPFMEWFCFEDQVERWDAGRFTSSLRRQMPRTEAHFVKTCGPGLVRVSVQRQHEGLIEHAVAITPMGDMRNEPTGALNEFIHAVMKSLLGARRIMSCLVTRGHCSLKDGQFVRPYGPVAGSEPIALAVDPAVRQTYQLSAGREQAGRKIYEVGVGKHKNLLMMFDSYSNEVDF